MLEAEIDFKLLLILNIICQHLPYSFHASSSREPYKKCPLVSVEIFNDLILQLMSFHMLHNIMLRKLLI